MLPGMKAALNYHPMFVHFPIVLWLFGPFFLYLGVVGIHETLMLVSTSLALALCIFAFLARKNFTAQLRKLMLLGLAVLAVLLTIGADRGAQLVYGYGTAVNWTTAQEQK